MRFILGPLWAIAYAAKAVADSDSNCDCPCLFYSAASNRPITTCRGVAVSWLMTARDVRVFSHKSVTFHRNARLKQV